MFQHYFNEDKILNNNINFNNFKPAEEDIGIKYKKELTFNLMQSITKIKNKESEHQNINKELLINLSLILNLCQEKTIPIQFQKTGNENKNYSYYIPLKKISIDNKIDNECIKEINKNIINDIQEIEINSQSDSKDIYIDLSNNTNKSIYSNNEKLNDNEISFTQCPILSDDIENSKDYLNIFEEISKNDEDNNILDNDDDTLNNEKKSKSKEVTVINVFNSLTNNSINNNINVSNITISKNVNKKNKILIFSYLDEKVYQNIINSMDKVYVQLMLYHYLTIMNLIDVNEKYLINEKMKINLFHSQFKALLFQIGINDISLYQSIIKNLIYKNKIITFEEFILSFNLILSLPIERIRQKYHFLYYLSKKSSEQIYYTSKDIQNFFKLITSDKIYEKNFSEIIINRLINRYNAIYQNDEKVNLPNKKYHIRKLNVVLDSFFDDYF
jgi:hypothetical protein